LASISKGTAAADTWGVTGVTPSLGEKKLYYKEYDHISCYTASQ